MVSAETSSLKTMAEMLFGADDLGLAGEAVDGGLAEGEQVIDGEGDEGHQSAMPLTRTFIQVRRAAMERGR